MIKESIRQPVINNLFFFFLNKVYNQKYIAMSKNQTWLKLINRDKMEQFLFLRYSSAYWILADVPTLIFRDPSVIRAGLVLLC